MNPSSPFLILPALAMVLLTTRLFLKYSHKNPPGVTYKTIDGLRGYLAFFVFLHHASIWYFYLHTRIWDEPPSRLYNHFGKTSVSVFFMITGFLFFSKLINDKKKTVDWLRFLVARLLRLYPVYLVAVVSLFIIVGVLTQWTLAEPKNAILFEISQWSTFTVTGRPEINHAPYMVNITADVSWSLAYEWVFYLSLPIIGFIFFRSKVDFFILLFAITLLIKIYRQTHLPLIHFYSFGGGLFAAFLVRWEKFRLLVCGKIFSVVAVLFLSLTVLLYDTPYHLWPLTMIAMGFIIIACGNSLFGLLANPVSRMLGQISYPIYLLHPILLFISYKFIIGFDVASQLPVAGYWIIISIIACGLMLTCYAVHYFIELPVMNASTTITAGIRKIFYPENKSRQ